jgi:hypothetical protein
MGDGRYYSWEQFFSIIFLTFLLIVITTSMMLSFYKNKTSMGKNYSMVIYVCIEILVLGRFVEKVIVSEKIGYGIKKLETIIFLGICLMMIDYFNKYVVTQYCVINKNNTLNKGIYPALSVIFILGMVNTSLYIEHYTFDVIKYTKVYEGIIGVILLLLIGTIMRLFFLEAKENNIIGIGKSKKFGGIMVLMMIIPLTGYLYLMMIEDTPIDVYELGLYVMFVIILSLITYFFLPYHIMSSAFFNIKDSIQDYVFIINNNKEIIYRNNQAEKADFFKQIKQINMNEIENIFNNETIKLSDYSDKVIQYHDENRYRYFSYGEKEIKNNSVSSGSIITFTDISKRIEILEELKIQQIKSEEINNKLVDYSKKVYRLEKENEINVLLEEIARTQQKSMSELKKRIEFEINKNEGMQQNLGEIIIEAKDNLRDVRKAVSVYMEYYGEKND